MLLIEDYKAIYDASPDGCLVVAEDGRIRGANARIEEIFGWTPDDLRGEYVEVLIPESMRGGHEAHRQSFRANPHNRPMGVGLDLRGRHKDGSTFPVEVSLSPWSQPDGRWGVICAVRDVSGYRRLRNFSEGALLASEEERKRIARELHDDTAQRLAALLLRVRALASTNDEVQRLEMFESVKDDIVEAVEAVNRMSRGLRPPEIEEIGLAHAVRAHTRSVQDAWGFPVHCETDAVDPHLPDTAKLALYRIIQEALSNARRHSGAHAARVDLRVRDGAVVVEVSDEGHGFATWPAPTGGLGLIGIQERAFMIGGRLYVDSAPDRGTRITVSVPIGEDAHA